MDKKYNLALRRIRSINVNDLNKIVDGGDMASRIKNNIVNSSSFLGNGQKIVKSIGGRNKTNIVFEKPRPDKSFLTTVNAKFIKIDIPCWFGRIR